MTVSSALSKKAEQKEKGREPNLITHL